MQKLTSLCEALKEERDELRNECDALHDDVNSLHHLLCKVKSQKLIGILVLLKKFRLQIQ